MKNDPQLAELNQNLEKEPENNSIRYKLAEVQFQNGLHQEAIDNCLDVYHFLIIFYSHYLI